MSPFPSALPLSITPYCANIPLENADNSTVYTATTSQLQTLIHAHVPSFEFNPSSLEFLQQLQLRVHVQLAHCDSTFWLDFILTDSHAPVPTRTLLKITAAATHQLDDFLARNIARKLTQAYLHFDIETAIQRATFH